MKIIQMMFEKKKIQVSMSQRKYKKKKKKKKKLVWSSIWYMETNTRSHLKSLSFYLFSNEPWRVCCFRSRVIRECEKGMWNH